MLRTSLAISGACWLLGCRCAQPAVQDPSPTSEPTATAAPARCSAEGTAQVTLESPGAKPEQPDQEAPFAAELGRAEVVGDQFVVPFLRGDGSKTQAGVLQLESTLRPTWIELGPVHGNAPPPKVTGNRHALVAAVPDTDASGGHYRLAKWSHGALGWLGEVAQSGDDSPAFDLALQGERGLLTWDDWDRALGQSRIRAAAFSTQGAESLQLSVISPEGTDAEAPRVSAHPDGFWVSWIALGKPQQPSSEEAPLAVSESWLELVQVDQHGKPRAAPLRLSEAGGHVTAYDVVAAHDGRLLFTVRDDGGGADSEDATLRVIRVTPEGLFDSEVLEAAELGASAPSLLFDPDPQGGAPHGWLVLAAASGQTTFAALAPWGSLLEPLAQDSVLGTAGVLAARQGLLLVANPQGRDSVLSLLKCRAATPGAASTAVVPELEPGAAPPAASPEQ